MNPSIHLQTSRFALFLLACLLVATLTADVLAAESAAKNPKSDTGKKKGEDDGKQKSKNNDKDKNNGKGKGDEKGKDGKAKLGNSKGHPPESKPKENKPATAAATITPNKAAPPSFQGRASDLVAPQMVKPKPFERLTHDTKSLPKQGRPEKNVESKSTGNVSLLREAYSTLSLGNHVYDGHRRDAMHQVDRAAHQLGADFSGDGKGREPQIISDAQLLAVKLSLEKGRGQFTGEALTHVDQAIKQLATALSLPRGR